MENTFGSIKATIQKKQSMKMIQFLKRFDLKLEGAQWLHVVDLDAARTGSLKNTEIIREICKQLEIPIQVGGGIREYDTARHLYDIGVERTVIEQQP